MTLLIDRRFDGPQTHAIVIGVGEYPHLEGGRTPRPDTLDLRQLTSPPHSALAMSEWLRTCYHNPEAPLATLELLISQASGNACANDDQGRRVLIERAVMQNAKQAILRWAERAGAARNNVTIFYFCGHGVAAGIYSGLLLEDFGSDHTDLQLLENVIDLEGLHLGMDGCKARQQLYFIDACRRTPHAIAVRARQGGLGNSILDGYVELGRHGKRAAPIFFACLPGQVAEADREEVSVFTSALIETLNGRGGVNLRDQWEISTHSVLPSLLACVRRRDRAAPEPAADKMAQFFFQQLEGPPEVDVTVECDPRSANAFAQLSLIGQAQTHVRPAPKPDQWELQCRPGSYDVCASFDGARYRSIRREGEVIAPPAREFRLDVKP